MRGTLGILRGVVLALALASSAARADEPSEQAQVEAQEEPVESDFQAPPFRKILDNWSEYDLRWLTFKWGLFTIEDFGRAQQSEASQNLIDVPAAYKIRDFRFSFSGKFALERDVTYTMGLMYDGPTNSWFPRETGIQIKFPELLGALFVGRQKEGISLAKITVGYAVWVMERMPISDASIPILADGVKWLGGLPSGHANWNIAYFVNELPRSPSKDVYDRAFVARFCLVPLHPAADQTGTLLHLGVAYHRGDYANDEALLRSRPESSTAPFFVDTGMFPAEHNDMLGTELYFRRNNVLAGAEYIWNFVHAPEVGNPLFHGGEAFVAWAVTGEIRPYIDLGGKIGFLEPKSSLFSGGTGALEAVLHFSYTDLDDGAIQGGRFWRLTPQLNWYFDDMVSLRLNYGLGNLDLPTGSGITQFFQARVQFQIQ